MSPMQRQYHLDRIRTLVERVDSNLEALTRRSTDGSDQRLAKG